MTNKCPSCGYSNIEGEDRCTQCLHTLHHVHIPKKKLDNIQSAMMSAPISDLVTGDDLLVTATTDSLDKVVKIFQEQKKNCVLVYKNQKMVGILSNRDILWKVVGKQKDLSKVKVGDVMTPNPEYVMPDDPIAFAVNKMAMGGFRHIPVIQEDGKPVSIILIKDVLDFLARREHKNPPKQPLQSVEMGSFKKRSAKAPQIKSAKKKFSKAVKTKSAKPAAKKAGKKKK